MVEKIGRADLPGILREEGLMGLVSQSYIM
jgi:hypothetical protein